MKRFALAATLILATGAALAQAPAATPPATPVPDIAKPKCDPKPEFPGKLAMQSVSRQKLFQREFNAYKDCMSNYVNEHNALGKANIDAANVAIGEYNAVAAKVNEAQKAANE
jgi:hypothetical protein